MLLLVAVMIGCKKEDPINPLYASYPTDILGNWTLTQVNDQPASSYSAYTITMIFNDDGTVIQHKFFDQSNSTYTTYSYDVSNDRLTINGVTFTITKLDPNNLWYASDEYVFKYTHL